MMVAVSCLILMSHSAPSAHIAPGEAERFLGTWTAVLESPAGPVSLRIAISVDEGSVVALVSSDLMSDGRTQEIAKVDQGIALLYTAERPGPRIELARTARAGTVTWFSITL